MSVAGLRQVLCFVQTDKPQGEKVNAMHLETELLLSWPHELGRRSVKAVW